MHLPLILELASETMAERIVVEEISCSELSLLARRTASLIASRSMDSQAISTLVFCDTNSAAFPVALFGSALAGIPFTPVNYRLADDALRALVSRTAPSLVIAGDGVAERLGQVPGVEVISRQEFLAMINDFGHDRIHDGQAAERISSVDVDPSAPAVLLFTSGTSGEPKAAVLRHEHLASYILSTVELASSAEGDAALVSVPPYHIAGVSAVLSNTYAGRRIVYLAGFTPEAWVDSVVNHGVTHAMVVPTMLHRVLDELSRRNETLPNLRHLSYGGGPMPLPVVERAMDMLPHVDFVNAYGLTETSSSIAVLGPDDHRAARASTDPVRRRRLGSVGQPLPVVEISIRDEHGQEVAPGERGLIWVRGPQVSGQYRESSPGQPVLDDDGWFNTRDAGELDSDGYLFVFGRQDDVIVRGGENLSPGEIEDVLIRHPAVSEAVVVGIPDIDWGEKVVAAVVLHPESVVSESEVQDFVRAALRSARTPEHIQFRTSLPATETGKILRRTIRAELSDLWD
ncbi:MAG: hypothetical protein RL119_891 [Actinomycetota bacterium]|jgi:acyl-CoA synthetase (AMP-forming)/AMP-acid ligase II